MSINVTERVAWSLSEMAQATGLSVPFLRLEMGRGNLKVTRFGRRILISAEERERYLNTGSKGAKAACQPEVSG
jgi:hypothetical protein